MASTEERPTRRGRVRGFVHKREGAPGLEVDYAALKDTLLVLVPGALVVIASFGLAARFIQPAPPDRFVMSTGPEGGAYQLYGERYRDIVARHGVTIELRPSAGSMENLERLTDRHAETQAALVQAGVGGGSAYPELRSLGAVYYEPLWIFHRGNLELARLQDLAGRRVAVGPDGSGTRALAMELLRAVGLDDKRADLRPLGGMDAAEALLEGRVDAAFVVGAPSAPVVQRLVRADKLRLASVANAEAFARRFTYLRVLTLPAGVLDLAAQIPARETKLLATTANLVVKNELHPALVFLMLMAATEVHGGSGILHARAEFPAARDSGFAMSEEAERYLKSGPPFLHRHAPFWLATFIERTLVLLVPLFAVLVPAFKILPAAVEWRVRSRVFRWYGELKYLEDELRRDPNPARLSAMLDRLEEIDEGVARTSVPKSYANYIYNLRAHLEVVRHRLERLHGARAAHEDSAPP